MQYTILYDQVAELLIDKVNQLIKQGWEPLGGLCATQNAGKEIFCQAMIKKEG
ncbi:MAG: DUF1737 domain-containing protein [Alphaproteobacteria bacterium]|nr:DUF1737 domain-containing protein [Alphaproteobacteria bacterium]